MKKVTVDYDKLYKFLDNLNIMCEDCPASSVDGLCFGIVGSGNCASDIIKSLCDITEVVNVESKYILFDEEGDILYNPKKTYSSIEFTADELKDELKTGYSEEMTVYEILPVDVELSVNLVREQSRED